MKNKKIGCALDHKLISEIRKWFLYYPEYTLSLNTFCNFFTSPYIICSSDELYPSDIEKSSNIFKKFISRGIIQPQSYGCGSSDSFIYSYHNIDSESARSNFLTLCHCYEAEVPFRFMKSDSDSTLIALHHFSKYLEKKKTNQMESEAEKKTNQMESEADSLSQYLHVLIEADVPDRILTTRKMQRLKVERELQEIYDARFAKFKDWSFDAFVNANLPWRDDYIYLSPDEVFELIEDPGTTELQSAITKLLSVKPTKEALSEFRDDRWRKAASQLNFIGKAGDIFFNLAKIAYICIGNPDWPDVDTDGLKLGINKWIASKSFWLLSLSEFTGKIKQSQIESQQNSVPDTSQKAEQSQLVSGDVDRINN